LRCWGGAKTVGTGGTGFVIVGFPYDFNGLRAQTAAGGVSIILIFSPNDHIVVAIAIVIGHGHGVACAGADFCS
jgi:hypothetical protein